MHVVSADPGTGEQGVHGSVDRVTGAWYIVQAAADPKGNLFQQSRRIDVVAEFGCGETEELVGLGVTARPKVRGWVGVGHPCRVGSPDDRRGIVDLEITHRNVELVDA